MIRICFFEANPFGDLDVNEEMHQVQESLDTTHRLGRIELKFFPSARVTTLINGLHDGIPTIVHFSGHGRGPGGAGPGGRDLVDESGSAAEGGLVVRSENGAYEVLSEARLLNIFKDRPEVRLVFLNACYTRKQAEVLSKCVPCLLGTSRAIRDEHACIFSKQFYRSLGNGRSVQQAYHDARAALPDSIPEAELPSLVPRDGLDASKEYPAGWIRGSAPRDTTPRGILLRKLRTELIVDRLDKYVYGGDPMRLDLLVVSDAVRREIDEHIAPPAQEPRRLSPGESLAMFFDERNQAILILGGEGSGKTILLLQLLDKLLDRAELAVDGDRRIPVVFPLLSWGKSRLPLTDWLVEQLNELHGINRRLAREWVEADAILPLLDGLHEVRGNRREACVEAINAFRRDHGLTPIVVTCRSAEYRELPPLRLHDAVEIQPPTDEQMKRHLDGLGPAGLRVKATLEEEPTLLELLRAPIMLNVALEVLSSGQDASAARADGTPEQRRNALFSAYVLRMLKRRHQPGDYSLDQTNRWLSWLARKMDHEDEGLFFLDRLQPGWLSPVPRLLFLPVVSVVFGLGLGAVVAVIYGPIYGWLAGLNSAAVSGFCAMLVGPYLDRVGFLGTAASSAGEIVCGHPIRWTWESAGKRLAEQRWRRIMFALPFGAMMGLIQGIRIAMEGPDRLLAVLWGVAFLLMFGVIGWLFLGLLSLVPGGLVEREIDPRTHANRGIERAFQNSIVYSLIYSCIYMLTVVPLVVFLFWEMSIEDKALPAVTAVVLGSAIVGGLLHGGTTVVKHIVVRVLLACDGAAPLRYGKFLGFASDRILLHRVGNGFQFHKLFLAYFKSLRGRGPAEDDGKGAKGTST